MTKKNKLPNWMWWALIGVDGLALAYGWQYPVKLSLFFAIQVGLIWWKDWRVGDIRWAGIPAIAGTAVEILAISGGAWSYSASYLAGVPVWLPLAYAVAGLIMRRLGGK